MGDKAITCVLTREAAVTGYDFERTDFHSQKMKRKFSYLEPPPKTKSREKNYFSYNLHSPQLSENNVNKLKTNCCNKCW